MDLTQLVATPVLPEWVLKTNLVEAFIWYISFAFVVSIALRLRFYNAIFKVARHFSSSCPNVYLLVHEHATLLIRNGVAPLVGVYMGILSVYFLFTRIVFPSCVVTVEHLATASPGLLAFQLILIGGMLTLDVALTAQTSTIDADQVAADLSLAESWLGGRLFGVLRVLGRWNPIKAYADAEAYRTFVWLNQLFHDSLKLMLIQTGLRLLVAFALFTCHMAGV